MNETPAVATPRLNPWIFIPVLYFMQAMPVTIVQEVAAVFFKDLGIANEPITRWTSLISLPWSLQMVLGPLVDLNGTKRRWILGGQFVISLGLILMAFALALPNPFEIALFILAVTAVTSALCNIATDGFYILSMPEEQRAKFVGVQTTFYRLGRLFCGGLLIYFAGLLMSVPRVPVETPAEAYLKFKANKDVVYAQKAQIGVGASAGGPLTNQRGEVLEPEVIAPAGTMGVRIDPAGQVEAKVGGEFRPIGQIQVATFAPGTEFSGESDRLATSQLPFLGPLSKGQLSTQTVGEARLPVAQSWLAILVGAALIYSAGLFWNRSKVPVAPADVPTQEPVPGENRRNVGRIFLLLAMALGGYFFLNAVVRLGLHAAWMMFDGSVAKPGDPVRALQGWRLPEANLVIGYNLGLPSVVVELGQLLVCGAVLLLATFGSRRLLSNTPMAEAITSYVRQPGFLGILGFIFFYRFGEALVGKMVPLFLKDSLANGGLAIPNEQLGQITGIAGVVGIIAGGLLGGYVVSQIGLRRAFWPLALAMHVPNLLYLYSALSRPGLPILFGITFVDQFGYGFGFSAYFVFLMRVAERGNFKTSHYAIGTGLGALTIATAGVLSGLLQQQFGYFGFFVAVIFFSIPGLLALKWIPLENDKYDGPIEAA